MAVIYDLTEEQTLLVNSVKEFLERECLESLVREVEWKQEGYSPDLWRKLGDVGFLGLGIPQEYGGGGGSFFELALFFEQAGRVLMPGPHLATLGIGAQALLHVGTEAQKQHFLPRIASGDVRFALAVNEREGDHRPQHIRTSATPVGDRWVLNGQKYFIKDAFSCTHYLLAARTAPVSSPEYGVTLFIVPADARGLSARPFRVLSGDMLAEVTLENVVVPQDNVLGRVHGGWFDLRPVLEKGKACLTLQMAGATDALMRKTVEYMKGRITFGRPLATNQALQHRMSQIAIQAYGALYQGYGAAWKLSQGIPASNEVSLAKIYASEAYRLCTNECLQFHGAYGFSVEFYVQLYWRRMRLDEAILGDSFLEKEEVSLALGL